MIYDSQEQKNFIQKLLLAHQGSYGEHMAISNDHALGIQSGVVIPVEKQQVLADEVYPPTPKELEDRKKKVK